VLTDVQRLKDKERKRRVAKGWYSDKQKLEAVQVWLLCGSMVQTAAALGIAESTIEKWRYTDWWKELADQIKAEGRVKLTGRLQKVVSRSLDQLEERIENGDWVLDSKTGQLIRKPLLARDLTRITTDFMDSSRKLDSVTKEEATAQAVEDRLKLLADSFASFANKVRKVEVEDVEWQEKVTVSGGELTNESDMEDISYSEDQEDTLSDATGSMTESSGTMPPLNLNEESLPSSTNSGSRVGQEG
jgi:hypothetical protein